MLVVGSAQISTPGNAHNRFWARLIADRSLLPLAAMIASLALLAAVVPPFDARLVTQPLIDLRDIGTQSSIEMPWGPWVKVTFRGRVQTFAELPSSGAPFDMWQLADGSCWVWMQLPGTQSFSWVDP